MLMREPALLALSRLTRRVHPKGTDRVLRLIHSPDRRPWSIEAIANTSEGIRFRVNTASFVEWLIFFYGSYEPSTQKLLRTYIGSSSTVIDIGANIGAHTLTMARLASAGSVIACEPNPSTYKRLLQNLELNNTSNVIPCQVALTDHVGKVTLFVPASSDPDQGTARLGPATHKTLGVSTLRRDASTVTVDAETLDHLKARLQLSEVSLVKIDVEGYEGAVLAGARNLLLGLHPVLIFEYQDRLWSAAGYELSAVLAELKVLRYEQFAFVTSKRSVPTPVGKASDVPPFANIIAL